jgi:hypothetical protein
MASRAFTTRFITACSSWPGSTRTASRPPRPEDQVHVLADHAPEHLLEVREQRVQIEDLRCEHLAPAEREELPGELRGPLGRAQDLLDPSSRRMGSVELAQGGSLACDVTRE